MSEEFSEQQVQEIVAAALASLEKSRTLPLNFSDSQLLQRLYELLPTYVGTFSDSSYIISQLRAELYKNVAVATPQKIHTACMNCTRCPDRNSGAEMPLWNFNDPDLLIVIENPFILDDKASVDLLVEALKRSGFNSQSCCLTYATRCRFRSNVSAENYAQCSSFCYNEIHSLQPKLTLAMGNAVWSILSGDASSKLKDIKGEIIWLGSTPIMPTYSLAYFHHAYKGKEDIVSYLESDLKKAYSFCYGDNHI